MSAAKTRQNFVSKRTITGMWEVDNVGNTLSGLHVVCRFAAPHFEFIFPTVPPRGVNAVIASAIVFADY